MNYLSSLLILPLACSGPGAMTTIYQNEGFAQLMWHATLGVTFCSVLLWIRRRDRCWLILPSITFSVFNPAWTVSARGGDCGFVLFDTSRIVLIFVAAMLFLQMAIYYYEENQSEPNQARDATE